MIDDEISVNDDQAELSIDELRKCILQKKRKLTSLMDKAS